MGRKTISIQKDTYDRLRSAKRKGEGFNDVIHRLLKKEKGDLSVYFGVLKDEEVLEGLEENCRKIRELSRYIYDVLDTNTFIGFSGVWKNSWSSWIKM
ncbi:TPA: antitoxin [Methanosarcinaceae archaeon]|nr:antitoxin [Methanosarcinaceae archaeon]